MRKLIFIGLALLIAGGGIAFYLFNKKVESLENKKADYSISSNDLFDTFEQNESEAQKKFVGKIVEVSGEVLRINLKDSIPSITLLAENSMMGGVNCSFSSSFENINIGDQIMVKCECQGFLMDVVLNNCVLSKKL